jgi:hypothetical protein
MAKSEEEPDLFISFKFRLFLRSLSYRDFLTSVALGLLIQAFFEVLAYYSSEELLEHRTSSIGRTLFVIFLALNHIVYKAEHKRSNNFIGRVIHDLIFIAGYTIINVGLKFLIGIRLSYSTTFLSALGIVIALLVAAIFFEICVAIVKRLLMLFKWQIF